MPPKAKAKGLGRPRAMAAMRRPAAPGVGAAPGRVRKRPAVRDPGTDQWETGAAVSLHEVGLEKFRPGTLLVVTEGDYFGAQIKAAGTIQRIEVDQTSTYLHLRLTGTDNENVLRVHTGQRDPVFKVHICERDCGRMESGELFFHALKGRKGRAEGEEAWTKNLAGTAVEDADELAALRVRGQARGDGIGEPGPAIPPEIPPVGALEDKEVKKKKKAKKKERSKEEKVNNGRKPSRAVQKDAAQLFAGTGLDPREKVRKRVMKAAQR